MEIHFNVDEINVSNKDYGLIDRCENIDNVLESLTLKYASTPLCRA